MLTEKRSSRGTLVRYPEEFAIALEQLVAGNAPEE